MGLSKGYKRYMKSEKWFEKREYVLKRDNYQCQYCKAVGVTLHVHHLNYDNFMHEKLKDLVTCCKPCHNILDKIRKILKAIPENKSKEKDAVLDFYGYPHGMPHDREVLKGLLITLKNLKGGR